MAFDWEVRRAWGRFLSICGFMVLLGEYGPRTRRSLHSPFALGRQIRKQSFFSNKSILWIPTLMFLLPVLKWESSPFLPSQRAR